MGGFTLATAALTSIKNTYDLASAALSLKESTKRDLALAEILPKLLDAQRAANEAVQQETALFEEIYQLKEEIRQLKALRSQMEEYERKRFFPGSIAYVPKESHGNASPAHYACANCYEDRQRIISLQPTGLLGPRRHAMQRCPSCKLEIEIGPEMSGDDVASPERSSGPLIYSNKGIV
jgi:rubrerythrin